MVPQNRWFIMENMENPIKMDDLGVALFLETSILSKENTSPQIQVRSWWMTPIQGFDPSKQEDFFHRRTQLTIDPSKMDGKHPNDPCIIQSSVVVEPTHFEKYARQVGPFPQVGVNIKNVWNHHPERVPLVSCHLLTSVNQLDPLLTDLGTTWRKFKFNKALWRDNSGSNSM